MIVIKKKIPQKRRPLSIKSSFLFPTIFLALSFLLMILPLGGVVSSVKALLSYVFIPQVRVAHGAVKYAKGVHQTVRELLETHQQNLALQQELEMNHMLVTQAETVIRENERLTQILQLKPAKPWKGIWAKVAYREPSQWNTIIIDKGLADGIEERSAVLSVEDGKEGLAGIVVEVSEKTSKVLLVQDEDFSVAVTLEHGQEEGLLVGGGVHPVRIKYIPLQAQVQRGDKVYTSANSTLFPAGILVGYVRNVREDSSFQTAQTVEVVPLVRSAAVKELFVISSLRRGSR